MLTGLAGIATSQVATALLGQESGPLVAVAAAVRDATPGSIAVPLIHLVKGLDKPLLVAGTTLGLLLLAGVAGTQYVRRPWVSYLIFAAMGGLGLLAVMRRANSGPYDFVPLLVGFATWVLLIGWLTSPRVTAPGDRRRVPPALRSGGARHRCRRAGWARCSGAGDAGWRTPGPCCGCR